MTGRQLIPTTLRRSLATSLIRLLLDDNAAAAIGRAGVDLTGWNVDIELRNATKPAGWLVLTDLLTRIHAHGTQVVMGRVCIETNVRDLAETTGLSKDTVARAIRRLVTLGLVDRVELRDGSGQFGRSVYRVDITRLCPASGGRHTEPVGLFQSESLDRGRQRE